MQHKPVEQKINIHTFGCKVNTYDSGLLQDSLQEFNFTKYKTEIHILNTCAVTETATLSAIRRIKKIKQINTQACVVVTGCAAQVDTDQFCDLKQADLIVANSHKHQMPDILKEHFQGTLKTKILKSNIFKKMDLGIGGGLERSHTRSFLKIQDGCDSFCTFCVIPFARGKSRSLLPKDIITKIIDLTNKGLKELVITGIHIGDYSATHKNKIYKLEDLIEAILLQTKIARLRISSLEPIELSNKLLHLYKNHSRLCPHFHMSIQSFNTKILKSMKRQYSQSQVLSALKAIDKNAFVGIDLITGFPGESEEDFLDTYKNLQNSRWTRLHVFPYSPRPNTYACKLPEAVDTKTLKTRAACLRKLSLLRYTQEAKKQIGQTKDILFLDNTRGLAADYWHIKLDSKNLVKANLNNQIRKVKITALNTGDDFFSTPLLGQWCPGPDLNWHGQKGRRILSPVRLPIPPPGLSKHC